MSLHPFPNSGHPAAAAQQLSAEGYALLHGAVPACRIAAIAADLAPRFDATPFCSGGFYGERTKRFGRLLIRSPHIADLVLHPAILALAESALGSWCDRIQLNLTQAIELHPGALAQFPHRDQDMWQGSLGEVEYLLNVMWPLTPFNDERTAKRISDALGTATEQRAMRNYAGHRLAPWLAHVMVSRQETARALLTPGEVMQLPATDELVLVAGLAPIRAKKLRYFEDANFKARLGAAPDLSGGGYADRPAVRGDDWSGCVAELVAADVDAGDTDDNLVEDGGAQQAKEPELAEQPEPRVETARPTNPLGIDDDADPAIDKKLMDRVRPLAPVLIGHAMDEAVSQGGEQLGLGL